MDEIDVWIAFPMRWFFHKMMLATDSDVFWEDAFQRILFHFVVHLVLKTVDTGLVGVAWIVTTILTTFKGIIQHTFNNVLTCILMRCIQDVLVQRFPDKIKQEETKRIHVFHICHLLNC